MTASRQCQPTQLLDLAVRNMTRCLTDLDFFGCRLRIMADSEIWTERFRQIFSAFSVSPDGTFDFELKIQEAEAPIIGPGIPLTWTGRQPDGLHGRLYEDDHTTISDVEGDCVTFIDHSARTAVAYVRQDGHNLFFGSALMLVVDAALSARDRHLVHGACLIERQSGRAILICVPSGGGKTTTALALSHDGFDLMTDDSSVMMPVQERPEIWGLPRAPKVHRRTAELLPWIGPLPDRFDENGEQAVSLEMLGGRIGLVSPVPTELGAIFVLGPRSPDNHRVEPLAKPDALVALAHDNVAWRPSGVLPRATRRFNALAGMIARVPTFQLSTGEELAVLPAQIAETLQNVVNN